MTTIEQTQPRLIARAMPATANQEMRTIDAVVATETPVERFDWYTERKYNEYLLVDGYQTRKASGKAPLVDSHGYWRSVKALLGSAVNFRSEVVDGERVLVATISFGASDDARAAFRDAVDGHLTDLSVGYSSIETVRVEEDETWQPPGDREPIKGPARILTKWELAEVSLTAIGADPNAEFRSMFPGKPEGKPMKTKEGEARNEPNGAENPATVLEVERLRAELEKAKREGAEEERARMKADQARRDEIRALANGVAESGIEIPPDVVEAAVADENCTAEGARARFFDHVTRTRATAPPPVAASVTEDELDKYSRAAVDSIVLRAYPELERATKADGKPELCPGARELAGLSTVQLVSELLAIRGVNTRRMSDLDILNLSLNRRSTGYHTTSDFSNLFANALNKSLVMGFERAPVTWPRWCAEGSAKDLRAHTLNQFGEFSSLAEVGEHGEVEDGDISDGKESVTPKEYARKFAITTKALINDDLGALARVPGKMGEAAAQTVEEHVIYQLMSNPSMNDNVALFHANHNNYTASGTAPTVAAYNTGKAAMRTQTGVDGKTLNLMPRFVLAPAALESTVMGIYNSEFKPGADNNERNPFNGSPEPIIIPHFDNGVTIHTAGGADAAAAANLTGWYFTGDPNRHATMAVLFYNGRMPEITETDEIDVLGRIYRVVLRFGVAPADYRAMYYNTGTGG